MYENAKDTLNQKKEEFFDKKEHTTENMQDRYNEAYHEAARLEHQKQREARDLEYEAKEAARGAEQH